MSHHHPGSRRTQHDHQDDPDDLFLAKVLQIWKWAQSSQQLLTVLGVVAVILVAGLMYYRNYREGLVQQAGQQLEAVYQTISLQDREGAKTGLVTFLQRFSGTAYEGEARLLLGELYLQTGDPQQAQAVLEPLGSSPREPIEFQAAALLAGAYEQEKRWSEAESVYLRIADRAELDFQVRDALTAAARIRADQGDHEGAIALYERVLGDLEENATERGLYEMRIEELRAQANA